MASRIPTAIKFSIVTSITALLTLSLISANFYDPTLFHQLYPVEGVRNWCGILGALTGGTLIELFGPASFLIPWFILKLSYSSKRSLHRFSIGYHALVLLLSISIAHTLWWPIPPSGFSDSIFLLYSGYTGILGAQWILQTIHLTGTHILIGAIVLFCTIKLFEELPFKILIVGIFHTGILLPIFLLQQLWQKFLLVMDYQWLVTRFGFLKTSSQHTSYLDSILVSDNKPFNPDQDNQHSDLDVEDQSFDPDSENRSTDQTFHEEEP